MEVNVAKHAKSDSAGEHQNVARVAVVLHALSTQKERGMRLTDVVEATGLGTATAHRLLTGLTANGFVDHHPGTNRYHIGLQVVRWAAAATERYGLAPFVDDILEQLCSDTGDTVYFSLLSGRDAVCVDRREGSFPIRTLTLDIGDRRPLGIGAGSLALLAFQPDNFLAEILADRAAVVGFGVEPQTLERDVEETRQRGYALNPGRLVPGMRGVAVPICREDGTAVAAISVAAIDKRLEGGRLEWVTGQLKQARLATEKAAAGMLNAPLIKRHRRARAD